MGKGSDNFKNEKEHSREGGWGFEKLPFKVCLLARPLFQQGREIVFVFRPKIRRSKFGTSFNLLTNIVGP